MAIKKIGWLIENNLPGDFIYFDPEAVKTNREKPLSRRAVQSCPAINQFEERLFQIRFPYDLRLRYELNNGEHQIYSIPEGTRIDDDIIPAHVFLMKTEYWRDENIPVIQIRVPYVFVSDDEVYLNQFPPFLDFNSHKLPGIISSGRFPIKNWPRVLSFGFEWVDKKKDLIFKRGDPWFYVFFETQHPENKIKLIKAESTEELKEYRKSMSEVLKYVSNSFSLFNIAKTRRPKKLLKEKKY
jgi:hypothetical protein|tara:strand:- start:710 stop:1432 length:723 start_codon:yes stop_codon:yes gene_type:complete